MTPLHTHLGIRFFEFEYIKIIQDSFNVIVPERDTPIPYTVSERDTPIPYAVSERDTPIQEYRVGT